MQKIDSGERMAIVATCKQPDYNIDDVSARLGELLCRSGIADLIEGKKVLIKPNCTGLHEPDEGRTTHPAVVMGLTGALKSYTDDIIIGESSSVGISTIEAYKKTGIFKAAEKTGIEVVDFKKSRYSEIEVNGDLLDSIEMPEEAIYADYILSAAKLKTNYVSTISCAQKNLKGLLKDEDKIRFHKIGVEKAVAEFCRALPKTVGIVDGILGSALHEPVNSNVLVASTNIAACDAVCAKIMGINPYKVEHIKLGMNELSGIHVVGEEISGIKKRFRTYSADEDELERRYHVHIKNYGCSRCLGQLYRSLERAKGINPKLLKGLNIIIGDHVEGSCDEGDHTVFYGNCSIQSRVNPQNSVCGCPPRTMEFLDLLRDMKH